MTKKMPLSKLCEPVTIYPQLLKNVKVQDKDAVFSDMDVMEAVAETERCLGDNGRVLLRKKRYRTRIACDGGSAYPGGVCGVR